MKKILNLYLLCSLVVAYAVPSRAQSDEDEKKLVRKIEVYGNAEREITPDEIYFVIALKEYLENDKDKVSIDKLERELYNAVRKIGVDDEDFQVQNVYGYNYDGYWRNKKKERDDFLAGKQYRITFNDLNEVNRLFSYLDPKGIQSTSVEGYSHSDIEDMRKELKIEALRNAKDKAAYMLEGIGERVGEIIEVQEINNGYQPPVYYNAARMEMAPSADRAQPEIDFKKIKLQFQVRTIFRIQ